MKKTKTPMKQQGMLAAEQACRYKAQCAMPQKSRPLAGTAAPKPMKTINY